MSQGIICSLTGAKAAFQGECSDFRLDEKVKIAPIDDQDGLPASEIVRELSPEVMERLRLEQRLLPGVISGLVIGLLGAIL